MRPITGSVQLSAAVHNDGLTGDELAAGGCEEHHGAHHIFRYLSPLDGTSPDPVVLGVLDESTTGYSPLQPPKPLSRESDPSTKASAKLHLTVHGLGVGGRMRKRPAGKEAGS